MSQQSQHPEHRGYSAVQLDSLLTENKRLQKEVQLGYEILLKIQSTQQNINDKVYKMEIQYGTLCNFQKYKNILPTKELEKMAKNLLHLDDEIKILFKAIKKKLNILEENQSSFGRKTCLSDNDRKQLDCSTVTGTDPTPPPPPSQKPKQIAAFSLADTSIMQCNIGGVLVNAVWDTGATMSLVSLCWVKENLTACRIRQLTELKVNLCTSISLPGGTTIATLGWIRVVVCHPSMMEKKALVPMIVTDSLIDPVIGLNVIQELFVVTMIPNQQMIFEMLGKYVDERKVLFIENQALIWKNSSLQENITFLEDKLQGLLNKKSIQKAYSCRKSSNMESIRMDTEARSEKRHQIPIDCPRREHHKTKNRMVEPNVPTNNVLCYIAGVKTFAVWDTGAMASLLSLQWKRQHLPNVEIQPLDQLGERFWPLLGASGKEIQIEGWIALEFSLAGSMNTKLSVPFFFVTKPFIPLIGLNIIEEFFQPRSQDIPVIKDFRVLLVEWMSLLQEKKKLLVENTRMTKAMKSLEEKTKKKKFRKLQHILLVKENKELRGQKSTIFLEIQKLVKENYRLLELILNMQGNIHNIQDSLNRQKPGFFASLRSRMSKFFSTKGQSDTSPHCCRRKTD